MIYDLKRLVDLRLFYYQCYIHLRRSCFLKYSSRNRSKRISEISENILWRVTFCQDLGTTLICQRQVVFFQQSPGQLLQNYYCKQNCAFSDVPEQPWSVNGKLSSSNNLQRRFSMPTIPSNSLENKYNIKADIRNVKWFTQIYLKHCQRHNRPKG